MHQITAGLHDSAVPWNRVFAFGVFLLISYPFMLSYSLF